MLAHSFDRFYIVTKFMLPSIGYKKFSKLNFDHTCTYMNKEYVPNMDSRKYLTELKTYCNKIRPFVSLYNKLIKSYNLVEAWYSLEQYIGLKEDKLSSTTVDFIRSEGNLETKCLYWFRKPKMC